MYIYVGGYLKEMTVLTLLFSLAVSQDCIYNINYTDTCVSVTIQNNITNISSHAFNYSTALTTVLFEAPSNLNAIGEDAFIYLPNLNSITLPKTLNSISGYAFFESTIKSLLFEPESTITIIGKRAFWDCTIINPVEFPASIQILDDHSLHGIKLSALTFEVGSVLTFISQAAFAHATINSIIFPPTVTYATSYSFIQSKINKICFEENSTGTILNQYAFAESIVETLILNRPGNYTFVRFYSLKNLYATGFITTHMCNNWKPFTNELNCVEPPPIHDDWHANCSGPPTAAPTKKDSEDLYYLIFLIIPVVGLIIAGVWFLGG